MLYVALLRGINLGAKRRIAMADLRSWATGLGHTDVRTLLASGNLLFRADGPADAVRADLERVIADGAGFAVDCVLRTAAELRAVVAADPLGDVADDPSRYFVVFLDVPGTWPEVDAAAFAPERVHLGEREAYFWVPSGIQDSRLLAAFPARHGEVATMRNWNTVTKLVALAGQVGDH